VVVIVANGPTRCLASRERPALSWNVNLVLLFFLSIVYIGLVGACVVWRDR
jgi:hypothetical protein